MLALMVLPPAARQGQTLVLVLAVVLRPWVGCARSLASPGGVVRPHSHAPGPQTA